jgi:hypothetical protein
VLFNSLVHILTPPRLQVSLGDLLVQKAAQQAADRTADDDLAQLLQLTDDDLDSRLFGQLVMHDVEMAAAATTSSTVEAKPLPYNLFKKADRGELWYQPTSSKRASSGHKAVHNTSPRQGRRRAFAVRQEGSGRGQVAMSSTVSGHGDLKGGVASEGVSRHASMLGASKRNIDTKDNGDDGDNHLNVDGSHQPVTKHPKLTLPISSSEM